MAGRPGGKRRPRISTDDVMELLSGEYGPFEWRPRHDPASELVSTILSQHTSDVNSGRAFDNLMAAFGSLEAGKYIGPLKAPVNGKLIEQNQDVLDKPILVNEDSYGKGWFVIIEPSNLEEDVKDLAHGHDDITEWLTNEIKEYREQGLLDEEDED